MPVINNDPRKMGDLTVTEFVDSVGTTPVTYTHKDTTTYQDTLRIQNTGPNDLTVSVGNQSNVTVKSYTEQVFSQSFTSFILQSVGGYASFRAVSSYLGFNEDGEDRLSIAVANTVNHPISTGAILGGNNTTVQAGTVAGTTYRTKYIARGLMKTVQLVYSNSYLNSSYVDTEGPYKIIIKASIEKNGIIYPCRFRGQKQITLDPGAFITSDEIGVSLNKDETFYVRTWISVEVNGNTFPLSDGRYAALGSIAGDYTPSGTVTDGYVYGFNPICIIGKTNQVSVIGIGDSIMNGHGDAAYFTYDGTSIFQNGFFSRALISSKSFINTAKDGQKITHLIDPKNTWIRNQMAAYATHAFVELGVNDLASTDTLDTIKTNLTTLWNILANLGLKVYQSTITPISTSTDSWTTVNNQTPSTTNDFQNKRLALNAWIRSQPSPLSGVVELADIVESARDSCKWKAGWTADGTHPTESGHANIASAFDVSIFK